MPPSAGRQRKRRIGVIADTHGVFDPAIRRHFKGVDHILRAGDIGKRSVIEQLEQTFRSPLRILSSECPTHTLLVMEDWGA